MKHINNNHGGKRPRSGRKKVSDPAVQLSIYPKQSMIKSIGGRQRAQEVAMTALIREHEKILKKNLVNA